MSTYHKAIIKVIQEHYAGKWPFHIPERIIWTAEPKRGGVWYPPYKSAACRIECGWEETDDILWHEIFHGVFHDSPLRKLDDAWGDGFCNAFHAFEGSPSLAFAKKIEPDVYQRAASCDHTRLYEIPCQTLINYCDGERARFKQLWAAANEISAEPGMVDGWFSRLMGYCPTTGRLIFKG